MKGMSLPQSPGFHLTTAVVLLLLATVCSLSTFGFRRERQADYLIGLGSYTVTRPARVTSAGDIVSHSVHHRIRPSSGGADARARSLRKQRAAVAVTSEDANARRGANARAVPSRSYSTSAASAEPLFLLVAVGTAQHVLELWPNAGLISSQLSVEKRRDGKAVSSAAANAPEPSSSGAVGVDAGSFVDSSSGGRLDRGPAAAFACHYVGRVLGHPSSTAAISTCDGLTGMILLNGTHYFIEPLEAPNNSSDDSPAASDNESGQGQAHVVYKVPPSVLAAAASDTWTGATPAADASAGGDDSFAVGGPHDIRKRSYLSSPHPACGVSDDSFSRSADRRRMDGERRPASSATGGSPRRRKRSTSVERHVEALVVVDPMMVAYYKDEDVETYVFTIMNMVSAMYHYATIGNAINIVVVKLMLLETDEPDLVITHHADNTLNSFCKWQQTINPDKTISEHHDVAILLTRQNICSKMNEPCSTLGLAQVMGMCLPHRSCNVNEDTGLALAYTVAHELGHNFGMKHDGQGSECPLPANDRVFIMAPEMITEAGSLLLWSNCSRDAITRFLDRGWGDCLIDEPGGRTRPDYPITPPGVMYDADHQCRLQYGVGSKHCYGVEDVCSTLWCRVGSHCMTRLEPAAEGTLCDADNGTASGAAAAVPKKWCFAGKCTAIGERPTAIDGGWAAWSSWSDCTRTCGGGVSSAERHCDNPMPSSGGRYCTGERRRHRICNTQSCPEGSLSFREVQCAEHNSLPYRGVLYEWEPVSIPDNPCQLVCKPRTMYFSVTLREVVRDGTPCRTGTRDMCLSGICRAVGCDWIIDSDAKEDRCGVCHGDGSTCKTIKDQFKAQEGMGYVEAAVIPEGARNIRVEEVAEANNYLAIRSERGEYYLNGHWFIQWSGDYSAAGTVIHYERNGNKEGITAVGPLREPLHIMLLFQSHNPGVLFEYTVPHENATRRLSFTWKFLDWSHCTVSCGGGMQRSKVVCSEQEAGIVEDIFCKNMTKPDDKARSCNVHMCPARWWTGPWQHCSATCGGVTGVRRRTVLCVRSLGPDEQMALDDADCEPLPRPQADEPCERHLPPCPTMAAVTTAAVTSAASATVSAEESDSDDSRGSWTPNNEIARRNFILHCSDLCDSQPSVQARECRRLDGQCWETGMDGGQQRCRNVSCGEWRIIGWTDCPCGGGEQRAVVACVDGNACSPHLRPARQSRYCDVGLCETRAVLLVDQTTPSVGKSTAAASAVGPDRNQAANGVTASQTTPSVGKSTAAASAFGPDRNQSANGVTSSGAAPGLQPVPDRAISEASISGDNLDSGAIANTVERMPAEEEEKEENEEKENEIAAERFVHLSASLATGDPPVDGGQKSVEDVRPDADAHSSPSSTHSAAVGDGGHALFPASTVATTLPPDAAPSLLVPAVVPASSMQRIISTGTVTERDRSLPQTTAREADSQAGSAAERAAAARPAARAEVASSFIEVVDFGGTSPKSGSASGGVSAGGTAVAVANQAHPVATSSTALGDGDGSSQHATFAAGSVAADTRDASFFRAESGRAGAPAADYDDAGLLEEDPTEGPATVIVTLRASAVLTSRWQTTEWSECSASCGHGWRTRSVWCSNGSRRDDNELAAQELSPSNCEQPPPESRLPCRTHCLEWVSGPWSQCSVTCGGGEQIRNVQCINRLTDQASNECSTSTKPTENQQCGTDQCPTPVAALHGSSGSDCTGNKLASSTCKLLKRRGHCLFTYFAKNCCRSCGGHDGDDNDDTGVGEGQVLVGVGGGD